MGAWVVGTGFGLVDHPAGCGLGEEIWAFGVDVDKAVEAFFFGFEDVDAFGGGDTGVVDEKVEAAEFFAHRLEEPGALGGDGDVGLADFNAPSRSLAVPELVFAFTRRFQGGFFVAAVVDQQIPAGAGERESDAAADAARTSGDQCRWIHLRGREYAGAAMARIIFHLDMDAFFAAIEQRDDPSLRGKPVIVGSPPDRRGVVCAASYEARKFGVRSAMPSITAGRLCPKGIFVPPRISDYKEESRHIMAIIARTGAAMEPMSIDEAYLDFSEALNAERFGEQDAALQAALPVARKLKADIQRERALTASIGVASNKYLAKIASDFQKPNGLTLIPERDKVAFLRPMAVRSIHGVGKVTEQVLLNAGIRTIGDLQDYQSDLRALVGSWAPRLKELAFGEDHRPLELGDDIKSISAEETFDRDTDDRAILKESLRAQAQDIAAKLKRKQLSARTVQVKVRYRNFSTVTRQISIQDPITEATQIYRLACYLLARDKLVTGPLRLLGTGVSGLSEGSIRQLSLF